MQGRPDSSSPEVLRALRERLRTGSIPGARTDGLRIVLAIEGGGMRGTLSGGMALALHELGLVPAFDGVYGASAGAISAAWLLSSRPEGLRGWAEPTYAKTLIRRSGPLRGRPVVDVRGLIEVVYQTQWPMDFGSVLASPVEYHPLATDAVTGASTDLRPLIGSPAELRLALRASASLPFLAGPPVVLRGRRFYDAGIAESIPFRTPLAQGVTHIVLLRSRRLPPPAIAASSAAIPDVLAGGAVADGVLTGGVVPDVLAGGVVPDVLRGGTFPDGAVPDSVVPDGAGLDGLPGAIVVAVSPPGAAPRPPREARFLARTALRKESLELRTAMLTRGARTAADVARIAELEAAGRALSVRPAPGAPPVSRLTTDGAMLAAAFEAGREAAYAVFT
jgi:predicted patatin/cPLA2 family phospholipase